VSSNRDRRLIGICSGVGLAALGVVGAQAASGSESIDPTLPQSWTVGAPRGAAPMGRVDARRSGRSASPLPSAPRVLWRARVQGGIAHAVVVDGTGAVVVASQIATLTQLRPDGKIAWSARTGALPAATAPVLLSDGTRVVLNGGGELLGFDASGKQKISAKLALVTSMRVAEPLPLEDGGVVVAAGRSALRLDRSGSTQASARLDAEIVALVARGSDTLLVTERGEVHSWHPPAEPSRLGSFAGRIDGVALARGRLTAVVDQKKLVDLELSTGLRSERTEPPGGLAGPPALSADGTSRTLTPDGLLLAHDAKGNETVRVALEPASQLGDGGSAIFGGAGGSPPVIVDDQRRVGFVRPGLDAGIVDPSGTIRAAKGAACLDPIGVAPAGSARMVLACRSGVVYMIGDK
jgi:hypothetical protein